MVMIKRVLALLGSGTLAILLLRQAETAAQAVRDGVQLCLTSVIPALFPFFAVSSLLVALGAAEAAGRALAHPFGRLFNTFQQRICRSLVHSLCIPHQYNLTVGHQGRLPYPTANAAHGLHPDLVTSPFGCKQQHLFRSACHYPVCPCPAVWIQIISRNSPGRKIATQARHCTQ